MNVEKIGKFIASCRKEKNLTQEQLAEKLGITSKAVSKWECGKGLPDVSLYQDICEILGITLNEFLVGEKLSDESFKSIADNNLLSILKNNALALKMKKYYKRIIGTIIVILIFLVSYLYFGDTTAAYHYRKLLIEETDCIEVNAFIMRNNHGDLLTYSVDILPSDEKIDGGYLFYYENGEKNIVLGTGLNMYDYARKNQNKREYGEDFVDTMLKHDLYFDLCLDSECNDIYKTIKLNKNKMF